MIFNCLFQIPPEIQIDLVGPRTPSPVEEECNLELPVSKKQYKFKVDYDQESVYKSAEEDDNEEDAEKKDKPCDCQMIDVATTPEMVSVRSILLIAKSNLNEHTGECRSRASTTAFETYRDGDNQSSGRKVELRYETFNQT